MGLMNINQDDVTVLKKTTLVGLCSDVIIE